MRGSSPWTRCLPAKSRPAAKPSGVQHGEGGPLRKNFRDRILCYACNGAADGKWFRKALTRLTRDLSMSPRCQPSLRRQIAVGYSPVGKAMSRSRPPYSEATPFVVSVVLGVLDAWDTNRRRSAERTITSKSAFFWSFRLVSDVMHHALCLCRDKAAVSTEASSAPPSGRRTRSATPARTSVSAPMSSADLARNIGCAGLMP